jgi:hypothetical protein
MATPVCDAVMNAFFGLDKHERLPLGMTLHLLRCRKCRTQVRRCALAEKACAEPLLRPADDEAHAALMARISAACPLGAGAGRVSLRRWIVSGVAMIAAMTVFGVFSADTALGVQLSFYIVFAGVVCAYCALFIGGNMDFFAKKIELSAQA